MARAPHTPHKLLARAAPRADNDGERTRFYKLTGESYEVIQNSLAFQTLTANVITQYLELSKTDGQTTALKAFRQMLRSRASS